MCVQCFDQAIIPLGFRMLAGWCGLNKILNRMEKVKAFFTSFQCSHLGYICFTTRTNTNGVNLLLLLFD